MAHERISLRHKDKRKNIAVFGAILLSLAIIGAITLTILLVNVGSLLLSDDSLKQEFKKLVYPLVMIDPPPIDHMEKADSTTLLQASIWYTLMNEDNSKYENTQQGILTIPVTDIEAYCAKLFGPGIKLNHQTFGDTIMTYQYDEANQVYNIPNETQTGLYTPKIVSYTQTGSFYYVTVGYIPPGPAWSGDFSGNKYESEPDKYMQYIIKKEDGKYYVYGIEDMPSSSSLISGTSSSSTSSAASITTSSQSSTSSNAQTSSAASDGE